MSGNPPAAQAATLHVGDRVMCPCYQCGATVDPCVHPRALGTVTSIRRFAVVVLDHKRRGCPGVVNYSPERLRVL